VLAALDDKSVEVWSCAAKARVHIISVMWDIRYLWFCKRRWSTCLALGDDGMALIDLEKELLFLNLKPLEVIEV
jgi:hypothetical protein